MNNNTFIFRISILFLISSIYVSAQKSTVKPISDYIDIYLDKKEVISKEIKSQADISIEKKLALYEKEISLLKEKFKNDRISEYKNKTIKLAKRHMCKGMNTRGVTDCKSVSINSPNENMHTKNEWVELESESTDKGISLVVDNSSVNINMTANGKRVNKAVVYATFKYIPERITEIVNKETVYLFNEIVNQ